MIKHSVLGTFHLLYFSYLQVTSGNSKDSNIHSGLNHMKISHEHDNSKYHLLLLTFAPSTTSLPSTSTPSVSVQLTASSDQSSSQAVSVGGYLIPLAWFIPIVVAIGLSCLFVTFYFPVLSYIKGRNTIPFGGIDTREPRQPALAMVV